MLRKTIIALCSLAMLAATLAIPGAPAAKAQNDSGLRVVTEFQIPGSRDVKYPAVVAANDQAHVSGNVSRSLAMVWSKAAAATSFPDAFELGPAEGQPDFSSTALARGPDGSIYAAWINNPARTVYMRRRDPGGNWGPTRTVERSGSFVSKPAIGVSSTGEVFVAWLIPDRPARYRFSNNGGADWSGSRSLTDLTAFSSVMGLAGGPNGSMAVTFTAGFEDRLQIFVGLWNGNDFDVQRVTGRDGDFADSSVSIAPNGKVFVAYRGVAESGGSSGVFYSERTNEGTWPRARLVGGGIVGTVSVNADEGNNLHFTWIREGRVFYSFKPSTSAPQGPITSGRAGAIFNGRGYGSISGAGAYNHAVVEDFSGSGLRTLYTLFQTNAVVFGGEPIVENNAAQVGRSADGKVAVTFRNVTGGPNQIRYAWNRAPNDSDPWIPFSPSMRLNVPEALYNSTTCQNSTLYTQLRNTATNQIESQPRSDAVLIDGVVSAAAEVDNALARSADPSLAQLEGAPGGDPAYARIPVVHLNLVSVNDCTGLSAATVSLTRNGTGTNLSLTPLGFEGAVLLPDFGNFKPGVATPYYVRVTDGVKNVRVFEFKLTIDNDKPVFSGAEDVNATPDSRGDILQDLSFADLNIRDTTFNVAGDPDPARDFWGFWIANSPTKVADPLDDPNLNWFVVKAAPSRFVPNGEGSEDDDYTITVEDWSLATGLTAAQRAPGDFFIYVRFLDGAGNVTGEKPVEIVVPSSQMQLLKTRLPLIRN